MSRRKINNKLLQADEVLDEEPLFAERESEKERVANEAFDDNDEEVEETLIAGDEDEMYESIKQERDERSAAERRRVAAGEKSSKGKTTKVADKVHDKDDEWQPANTLQAPPRRQGMVQRWIRFALGNDNDPRNWTRAIREGWKPRPVESVPEGFDTPTIKHGSTGTVIAVGDLILCEMPVNRFKSRRKYFREKLARQLQAIERKPLAAAERMGGPGIRVTNKKTSSYGRGRRSQATEE